MSELLRVTNLRAGYGKVEILHGVSLELEAGTLCAIVGANGAGKTTLLLAISSVIPKRGGSVFFAGLDISRVAPHDIVRRGLAHVPEGRRMLPTMTVDENLLIAAAIAPRGERSHIIAALYERFPILGTRRNLPAGSLSGGEQQMLAIARAMATKPRLLLLDEPSMGLAPKLVSEIFAIVAELRSAGTTILLVEQNARRALAMADRAYVLERGRIVLSGTGAELATNRDVTTAYLGTSPT
jgi:branched-chain amino acid transport system ATP-binding protein